MINNPYTPGDPACYDLKWIAAKIKHLLSSVTSLISTVGTAQNRADSAYNLADNANTTANTAKTWIDNNGALHISKTLTQPTDTDEYHTIPLGQFISDADIANVIALIKAGRVIFDIKITRNLIQSDGQLENYISIRPEYHTVTPGYLDGPCISAFTYIPYTSGYWETISLYYYPGLEDGDIIFGHA